MLVKERINGYFSGMRCVTIALSLFLILLGGPLSAQRNNEVRLSAGQRCFIENKGQITDQYGHPNGSVRFLLPGLNGMNVQLRSNGFSYDTYTRDQADSIRNYHLYTNRGVR